jgi:hypothetical protein
MIMHMLDENGVWVRGWGSGSRYGPTVLRMYLLGPLRRAFLTWISELPTGRLSMSVSHLSPKLVLNAGTSKKE